MDIQVPVQGETLHVKVTGEGAPILLWHSLLCGGWMWTDQVPVLSQHYQVINLDMRGHGESSLFDFPYNYWELSRDVGRVLDRLNLSKVVMIGLSMGGMSAFHVAVDAPQRLAGIVAIAASADPDPLLARLGNRIVAEVVRRVGLDKIKPLIDRQMFGTTTLKQRPEVLAMWNEHFSNIRPEGFYRCIRAIGSRDNLFSSLKKVAGLPALILVGEEDKALEPKRAEIVSDILPGAQFQAIPQAGHLCALEQPDIVNAALLKFLGQIPGWEPHA